MTDQRLGNQRVADTTFSQVLKITGIFFGTFFTIACCFVSCVIGITLLFFGGSLAALIAVINSMLTGY
jgi:hypothetical protein